MCVKVKYPVRKSVSVLAVAMLSACGGGGGGGSSSGEELIATENLELSPGLYSTDVVGADETEETALSFLSPTGNFVTVLTFTDMNFGTLNFDGENSISGSGTDIFRPVDQNGNPIAPWQSVEGSFTGTILTDGTATLKASVQASEVTVNLERNDVLSDKGLTLDGVSGIYSMMGEGGVTTTITIEQDGSITGGDGECSIIGQLSIPNPIFNVFEVNYSSTCVDTVSPLRNGDFSGLGFYTYGLFGEFEGEPIDILFASQNGEITALFLGTEVAP